MKHAFINKGVEGIMNLFIMGLALVSSYIRGDMSAALGMPIPPGDTDPLIDYIEQTRNTANDPFSRENIYKGVTHPNYPSIKLEIVSQEQQLNGILH